MALAAMVDMSRQRSQTLFHEALAASSQSDVKLINPKQSDPMASIFRSFLAMLACLKVGDDVLEATGVRIVRLATIFGPFLKVNLIGRTPNLDCTNVSRVEMPNSSLLPLSLVTLENPWPFRLKR